MNILFWTAIAILASNVVLLIFLLMRSHQCRNLYVITYEIPPKLEVIAPNELRESAWRSWTSAHPDASPIEQSQAQWRIEKEVHKLEMRNRQPHPFANTQKPRG